MPTEERTELTRWRPPTGGPTAPVDSTRAGATPGRLQLMLIGLVVAGGLMASVFVWQQRSAETAEQQTNPATEAGAR